MEYVKKDLIKKEDMKKEDMEKEIKEEETSPKNNNPEYFEEHSTELQSFSTPRMLLDSTTLSDSMLMSEPTNSYF